MLDRVFGALPAQPELYALANVSPIGWTTHRREARRPAGSSGLLAGPVSRAKIRISWPPTSSTISLAAVRSPRDYLRRCAKSAALLIRCPTIWYGSITRAVPWRHRHARRPHRPKPSISSAKGNSAVLPTAGLPGRTGQGQGLPQRLVCAQSRYVEQDRGACSCSCSSTVSSIDSFTPRPRE